MLDALYIALRLLHFAALMAAFGYALYAAWWAPYPLRRLLRRRYGSTLACALWLNALSATLILIVQGGLMGSGWADVLSPPIWQAVADTRFGSVWLWQIVLAWLTLAAVLLRPRRAAALLLVLCIGQFMLQASVGHAAMHGGTAGALQRINHTLHLLCGAAWLGGLLPFLYCLRLAHGRWRQAALAAMMRFSRYGHLAVAGVIASGAVNTLLIQGRLLSDSDWGRALLLKSALVALMVVIALANRYLLVPGLATNGRRAERLLVRTTQAEIVLGALVLAAVSLFATWEPF